MLKSWNFQFFITKLIKLNKLHFNKSNNIIRYYILIKFSSFIKFHSYWTVRSQNKIHIKFDIGRRIYRRQSEILQHSTQHCFHFPHGKLLTWNYYFIEILLSVNLMKKIRHYLMRPYKYSHGIRKKWTNKNNWDFLLMYRILRNHVAGSRKL